MQQLDPLTQLIKVSILNKVNSLRNYGLVPNQDAFCKEPIITSQCANQSHRSVLLFEEFAPDVATLG